MIYMRHCLHAYFTRHSRELLIILLIFTLTSRAYPIFTNRYCFSDDCHNYYNYILAKSDTPEMLFLGISRALYAVGINEVNIVRLWMILLPIVFTIGLYLFLTDRVGEWSLFVTLMLANTALGINLLWFVLIKQGLAVALFPVFLYCSVKKNPVSLVLMIMMMLSPATALFLILPVLLVMIYRKGDISVEMMSSLLMLIFYYAFSPQSGLASYGLTNLNYLFVDVFLLLVTIPVIMKLKMIHLYTFLFVSVAMFNITALLLTPESWRVLLLTNITALFPASIFFDEHEYGIWRIITVSYLIVSLCLFGAYALSLHSETVMAVGGYEFLGNHTHLPTP